MKSEKENLSTLTIVLILLVVVFAASTAILFKLSTKEAKLSSDSKCTNINKANEGNINTVEIKANNYRDYINNLENNIHEYFKKNPNIDGFSSFVYNSGNGGYRLKINKNLELIADNASGEYSSALSGEYKIADNVVSFFRIHTGNGLFHTIYYINKDGNLFSVNFEEGLESRDMTGIKTEALKLDNVVNVVTGTYPDDDAERALFVTIDGKVLTE